MNGLCKPEEEGIVMEICTIKAFCPRNPIQQEVEYEILRILRECQWGFRGRHLGSVIKCLLNNKTTRLLPKNRNQKVNQMNPSVLVQ